MKRIKILLFLGLMLMSAQTFAQQTFDMPVWTGNVPNKTIDRRDTAKIRVFLPNVRKATGRAILICPGGGYENLAMNHEGYDWAPFFNDMGIAVIVLKYRMPHGETMAPISDAQEAMRIIRRKASVWKINPNDVGIMGSSAGGHLASTVATHAKGNEKPNFQILFYPVITMMPGYTHQGSHNNLLGKDARKKDENLYSNDLQVSRITPRGCIILADDDDVVPPANGVNYYNELYRHDVPASLFVYPSGGHGFGISTSFKFHIEMLLNLRAWLNSF